MEKIRRELCSKKTLYTVCFVALMLIDWTRGSQVGVVWAWTVNMTGIVMAVILFSAYQFKDFRKPVFLIYSVIGICAIPLSYWWWNANQAVIYRDKLLSAVLNVWLLGLLMIRFIQDRRMKKQTAGIEHLKTKLRIGNWKLFGIIALFWMFLSVNEDVWPLWYLIIFVMFYYAPFTKIDLEHLKQGILNGIICAFFILQSLTFVFRPFDDPTGRYAGIYSNPNMNALFYSVVWVAFMCKLYYCRKEQNSKVMEIFYFLFSAGSVGFLILTICKTAWIAIFAVAIVYVILADFVSLEKKTKQVLSGMLVWLLVVAVSVPICYAAARYLPPVFRHPIWFDGEYSEDRVHSFDPWDSEKYVSFAEWSEGVSGRIRPFIELLISSNDNLISGEVLAAEEVSSAKAFDTWIKETFDLDDEKFSSAIGRIVLGQYYLTHGTLMGHLSTEGHDIGIGWYVWHTQNMFIQLWYYYGIPSAIAFLTAMIGCIIASIKQFIKGNEDALIPCLFVILFGVYGLSEATWYPGQMVLLLGLLTPRFLWEDI